MNLKESAEIVLGKGIVNHSFTCSCVQRGKINDGIMCDCGATKSNQELMEAFQWMVKGIRDGEYCGSVAVKCGVESPTYKFT